MAKQQYGILGGTFDPIHIGHLIAAQASLESLTLDRVLFLPSAHPPHKPSLTVSSYAARREMVRLAIQGNPCFGLSDLEAQRPDPSYTVRTLKDLRREYPPARFDLFLLIGADSLLEFGSWRDPEAIFSEISVAVFSRPGYDASTAPKLFRDKAHWVTTPLIDISSTEIRQRVGSHRSIRYLVPNDVEEYIVQNGLYCSTGTGASGR
jgi:nicotinate-nucleotide adenylyltransferase